MLIKCLKFGGQYVGVRQKTRRTAHLIMGMVLLVGIRLGLADTVVLQNVQVSNLPNDETQIILSFDGTPPDPHSYDIDRPARISVDLDGVRSALSSKYWSLGMGNAQSMTVLSTPIRTRLIIKLAQMSGHQEIVRGHQMVIRLGHEPTMTASVTGSSASSSHTSVAVAGATAGSKDVTDISFHRGSLGDGQVQIHLADSGMMVDVRQVGKKIIARIPGAEIPRRLQHRFDVADFATPVHMMVVSQDRRGGLIVLEPQGDYEFLSYQADRNFTISVKPLTREEKQRKSEFAYTGQKLSLNFQDIDVRSVLQLIADFTNMNLVASDTVTGKITLRLQNVPWDQALDLILKTKGLAKRTVGNVMLIAPAAEIAQREKQELEANKQDAALAPLHTEFMQVSYAKAIDLAPLAQKLLTTRGSLSTDSRTNMLIVNDTAQTMENIRDLVRKLDIPVREVMIEAKVVLANTSLDKEMGVSWGAEGAQVNGNSALVYGGSNQTLLDNQQWFNNQAINPGFPVPRTISYPQNLAVDMSVHQTGGSSIALGYITSSGNLLSLELSAFQSEGHGEVVASPRVMTADKTTATIASGQQIPYQQATSSGATSTSFISAVLSLKVTPSITPDGRIQMNLSVHKDSPSTSVSNNQLLIDTNSIDTNVLVNDGETVVLGGIYQTSVTRGVLKVPLLGDIPYLGALFRKDTAVSTKQELLIFITPKIYHDLSGTTSN